MDIVRIQFLDENEVWQTMAFSFKEVDLKAEARRRIMERVAEYSEILGVQAKRVTIRDTTSRWGSCSSARFLSFSWRLVMAPPHVLDYVVAHEVAHLRFNI